MVKSSISIGLSLLVALACTHQPVKKEVRAIDQKAEVKRVIPPPEEAESYQLSHATPHQWLDDYRFGKFFRERAEFFIIKNPKSKILDSGISTIVLYYLDGVHCQTRFILNENIADKTIAQYGTFSITPLDQHNKTILQQAPVLIDHNGQKKLNPALTRYELQWKLPTKYIRLRVDKENAYEPYMYSEHVPNYDKLFRELELATL